MTNEKAGALLRELLDAAYLSNSEAARRAGVSLNTIKKMLTGAPATPPKLRAVASIFSSADAARLVEAFGLPGLMGDSNAIDEAQVLADIITETEALALEAGVHVRVVADRLGHASPAITLSLYSHSTPKMDREAAEAVSRLVGER